MPIFPPKLRAPMTPVQYVGDTDTGMVHVRESSCSAEASELFLDLRTAMIRGYSLCRCCQHLLQPRTANRQSGQHFDRN